MSDSNVLLLGAGSLIAILMVPVSQRVRTALFLLAIGFTAWWEITSGLLTARGMFD